MNSIAWKLNRLRLMGPAEIVWRSKKAIQARLERRSKGMAVYSPTVGHAWGQKWVRELPSGFDTASYCQAADRILSGQFDVFALHQIPAGFPPPWNRDPKTGIDAPMTFGKALNYRDEGTVGDIKYLWEINRHYELVTLAQAYHLSGKDCYANGCRLLLDSWLQQCPYPLGQAWSSALENAIRLLNWAVAWHLLDGEESHLFAGADGLEFKQRWLGSIHQHCQFIAGHFSFYSSANNHLLGEYMGLFIGAITWTCWEESLGWIDLAKKGLEKESLKQNTADGVNREQAIWYHHEVADMMLLSALFGRANDIRFSPEFWKRLESMLEFIMAVMDIAGRVPMIGDSDNAVMVRFSQEPDADPYHSLLMTGAILFDRADFRIGKGRLDDKSRWLLGDCASTSIASLNSGLPSQPLRRAFPEGGYYVLGQDFGLPSEQKIVADAGPLGYLSIAAHGHADALMFTLSVAGKGLLIDPGTYAYHTQKKWRAYFRGTSAHNTVRVDHLDQSETGGNFMWLRKAHARCESWESNHDSDCFVGSHDGYLRLADPVLHRRKIEFQKQDGTVLVEDILECRQSHELEFHWHFSEACKVKIDGSKVIATCENIQIEMTMPDSACLPELVIGRENPPLGWISPRFDEKLASPSIVWAEKINGTTKRTTLFRINTSIGR
jgi:hypothetical protein